VEEVRELAADRLSSSYGRRLHQGRAGAATGIPDLLQWWRESATMYPILSLVGSLHHFNPCHLHTVRMAVQHRSDCMTGIIV